MVVDLEEEDEDKVKEDNNSNDEDMTRMTVTTTTTFFAKPKKLSEVKQTPAEQPDMLSHASGVQF